MKSKRVLFGTDGVRDVANKGGMTPEMALRLGRAFILFMAERALPSRASSWGATRGAAA